MADQFVESRDGAPVPEPSTWISATMPVGVAGLYPGRRCWREFARPASRNVLVVICCGLALLPPASFATPREDIVRAVAVSNSEVSKAPPRDFLQAFAAVALRAEAGALPNYVSAAIKLRPDLTMNTVVVAVKIAAKNLEENPPILCPTIDSIVKAAIKAKPDAVVSIAEAAAYGLPQLRDCVVNAAIAAAPEVREAIENAVGVNNIPHAFLMMSATDTNGFWFTPATLNPENISQPAEVISPEQPPSG